MMMTKEYLEEKKGHFEEYSAKLQKIINFSKDWEKKKEYPKKIHDCISSVKFSTEIIKEYTYLAVVYFIFRFYFDTCNSYATKNNYSKQNHEKISDQKHNANMFNITAILLSMFISIKYIYKCWKAQEITRYETLQDMRISAETKKLDIYEKYQVIGHQNIQIPLNSRLTEQQIHQTTKEIISAIENEIKELDEEAAAKTQQERPQKLDITEIPDNPSFGATGFVHQDRSSSLT